MTDFGPEPPGATPIHPDERLGLKHSHITTRGELNELEAVNIEEGLDWLEARRSRFDPLDQDQASELHRRLFRDVWEWVGEHRLTEKNIGVPGWQISTEMRICLDDARFWVDHGTYADPLEAGATFHHRLVKIHPYPNGNGRWARFMADAFLDRYYEGVRIDWSAGADLTHEGDRRQQYINALTAADYNDFGPLLEFVGAGR